MLVSLDWQLQKKVRVLIAADDLALAERLRAYLDQGGDTQPIGNATNGRECLELLKEQAPDVLLIADGLPGEAVLDLCREAIHIHPRIAPVILAQNARYRDHEYLHAALDTGVCDVIRVEPPYAELRFQYIIDSVMQAYNLIQERISGIGGGIGRVISLFSLKGGVGKTTIASNLAFLLATQQERRRVMLADFNWRFGALDAATGHLAHQSVLELIPVLDGISRTDLESIAPMVYEGLRLLPAPLDAERAEFTRDLLERDLLEDDRATLLDTMLQDIRDCSTLQINKDEASYLELVLRKEKVKQILAVLARRTLQSLRRNYHYIVADTNANLDDVTLTTLELSDVIVLVCTPDVPSIRATRAAITLLGDIGVNRSNIAYVINRASRRSDIRVDDIRNLFPDFDLLGELPADYSAMQPFINTGELLASAGQPTPLTRAYNQLTSQLMKRAPIVRAG